MKKLFYVVLLLLFAGTKVWADEVVIEFEVIQPDPLRADVRARALENQTWQLEAVVEGGTPFYTFRWMPETGLSNPKIANPILLANHADNYTLEITDNDACFVIVDYNASGLSLENKMPQQTLPEIRVDAKTKQISIFFPVYTEQANLFLYNMQGERLKTVSLGRVGAGFTRTETINNCTPGIYFVRLETPSFSESKKISIP